MNVRVSSLPGADAQAEAADTWWQANRPSAPLLFVEELRAATVLLSNSPEVGQSRRHRKIRGLRRLLLPATWYHVYYILDRARAEVLILAVWSAVRGRRPRLDLT